MSRLSRVSRVSRVFLVFTVFLGLSALASAQLGGGRLAGLKKKDLVAIPEVTTVAAGDSFDVILQLTHQPGFHSYFINPGVVGFPLGVDWQTPEGVTVSPVQFPTPHTTQASSGDLVYTTYGYEGVTHFLVTVSVPESAATGPLAIAGAAAWQVCDDSGCLSVDQDIAFTVQIAGETTTDASKAALFEKARAAQPQPTDDWEISATEADNVISLKVTFPAGISVADGVHFFASDQQVDAQAEQDFAINGQTLTATLQRNLGNEIFASDPAEVLDTLSGVLDVVLADGSHQGYEIATDRTGAVDAAPSQVVEKAAFIPATEEEKAAGLALWDPDTTVDYVLLGGEKEEDLSFIPALGLVLIGGLLLNLMPCVFPVLGLKIMGFVSQAGEDESKIKVHGLVFGAGLLVAMWVLAAIIIALDLSWGEQLGNPIFLGSIIILLFVLGLNLYGLFEFGTSLTSVGGDLQGKKGYSGSFFSGVLTTLIATPCSGPFLGAVMGYALSQEDKLIQFAVFTVFGLGISLPYVILGFFPKAIKKLPQPGAWMESFKQLMAFAMFATVVFFMKSYVSIVGIDNYILFLFALLAIALATYIYGRWGAPYRSAKQRRVVGYGIAGAFAVAGASLALHTAELDPSRRTQEGWAEWYPGKLEASRQNERIMWLDFTADW